VINTPRCTANDTLPTPISTIQLWVDMVGLRLGLGMGRPHVLWVCVARLAWLVPRLYRAAMVGAATAAAVHGGYGFGGGYHGGYAHGGGPRLAVATTPALAPRWVGGGFRAAPHMN